MLSLGEWRGETEIKTGTRRGVVTFQLHRPSLPPLAGVWRSVMDADVGEPRRIQELSGALFNDKKNLLSAGIFSQ